MALANNLFFLFLHHLLLLNLVDSKCQRSFDCGKLGFLEFPLSPKISECGLFRVDHCDSKYPKIQLAAGGPWFDILSNLSTNRFLIRNPELQKLLTEQSCLSVTNVSLPQSPSIAVTVSPNLTLFTCHPPYGKGLEDHFNSFRLPKPCPFTVHYKNLTSGAPAPAREELDMLQNCLMFQVPIKSTQDQDSSELFDLLSADFTLEWYVSEACHNCHHGGGQCVTNNMNEFYCKKENPAFRNIFLIGGLSMAALTSTFIILFFFIRRKYTLLRLLGLRKGKSANGKDIELFLKENGNLAPRRYRYSEVKKMIKSFNENLGNGEEFMSEVASISRTSHINIVSLLGFCFEDFKRALIYEFMPNGSLEKFIQNSAFSSIEGGLGWQKLFDIALGIARGLEYLHQGCKTRIVHFDIKPHNILLDKDLNPRIYDFGLAKLCPNRSSIVSMSVARGTIGYIAPEVFSRSFGEVSHKSDVYSYGMMILELARGKTNIDPNDVDRTSEIYFLYYIYKQLEMDAEQDGSLVGLTNEDESQFAKRKLIIVGLWCIQTDPRDRPSMTKVVEMLEGKFESLQVPPRPYLYSPPRPVPKFSISESM